MIKELIFLFFYYYLSSLKKEQKEKKKKIEINFQFTLFFPLISDSVKENLTEINK
jgi:hypothetical protein